MWLSSWSLGISEHAEQYETMHWKRDDLARMGGIGDYRRLKSCRTALVKERIGRLLLTRLVVSMVSRLHHLAGIRHFGLL